MKISVIVPTYKPVPDYMEQCLSSLFLQTFNHSDFEIIIVLNGCDEPYKTIINDIRRKLDSSISIKLIQTDVPGQSNARNIGMEASEASYYCFIDYDDWVSPTYLERLYAVATNSYVAQSYVISVNDSDNREYPDYIGCYYDKLYGKAPCFSKLKAIHFLSNVATKLISREIVDNGRFIPITIGEDALFMALISNRIHSVVLAQRDAVYYRRVHLDSLVHRKRSFLEFFKNRLTLTLLYLKIFFSNIREYNLFLFLHRIIAVWRGFFKYLFC